MARIVDVERTLPVRPYGGEGALVFEVLDDLCPWNQGRWRLETSGDQTSVKPTAETPELVMPVSTLTMIVMGQISATQAARMGRLEALDPGALPNWDRLMRTAYRPHCADLF